MNKIPIGKVISESFDFAFQRYLPLLGVLWLPMLLSVLFSWFVMFPHFLASVAGAGRSPVTGLAMESVHLALLAVMSVGVTKEALGRREGPRYVYLSVGTAELRVFGGYILLGIFTIVLVIVLAVIAGLLGAIASGAYRATSADPVAIVRKAVIVAPFVIFGVLFPLIYFWIRLSSFQTAVAVTEHRFGLWRSWALTRRNFWRLFAIVMTIWIPLMILYVIALSLTMGPFMAKLAAAASAGPEAVRAAQSAMLASVMGNLKYYMLVFFPAAPIIYGLIIAPGALLIASSFRPPRTRRTPSTDRGKPAHTSNSDSGQRPAWRFRTGGFSSRPEPRCHASCRMPSGRPVCRCRWVRHSRPRRYTDRPGCRIHCCPK